MRRAPILMLFVILVSAAFAQTTTVTGTVTDPDSTNWANGNITFNLIGSGGPPYYCNGTVMTPSQTTVLATLNGSGAFSTSLCSTTSITPRSTQWQLRVCSATSAACQNLASATSVSGASQSLTSFINGQLTAIRIPASTFNTRAYTDTELVGAASGFSYFNLTSSLPRFWNGSAWANTGAGSSVGVSSFNTRTGAVTPQSGDYTAAMVGALPSTTTFVSSFNTRHGAVAPASGDYTAAQVTNALDLSQTATQTMSGNLAIPVGSSIGAPIIRDAAGVPAATLSAGRWTIPANTALSLSSVLVSGTHISGGTGTTTVPVVLIQPSGTTTSNWSTNGTYFGINVPSGFTGDIFSFLTNGGVTLHLTQGGTLTGAASNFANYQTTSNCSSIASPAVCGSASGGSIAVPAGTNPTLTVNTNRILATSQLYLVPDQTVGTRLGVTCNTTIPTSTVITARVAGTSFTFQTNGTFTTNPVCYNYLIFN